MTVLGLILFSVLLLLATAFAAFVCYALVVIRKQEIAAMDRLDELCGVGRR